MDYMEKEMIVSQIVRGQYFIEWEDKTYIYNEPSPKTLMQAQRRYTLFCKHEADGFLTQEEAEQLAIDTNVWSDEDENKLKQCQENIKTLKIQRPGYKFQSAHLTKINEYIKLTEEEAEKLLKRKYTFSNQTVSHQANYDKHCWLLVQGISDIDGNPLWGTFEQFEEDNDLNLVVNLIRIIFYEGIFKTPEIREIARSEPWRTRWKTANKVGMNLFDNNLFGNMQHQLCYWTNMYDSVFESMDCPPQDIINNDDLLNGWFEEQSRKFEERAKKQKTESDTDGGIKNKKIRNAQEIFIKVDSAQDAQEVYSTLNSPESRRVIKRRQEFMKAKGNYAKEQHLPDVQENLQMQVTQQYTRHVKNIAKGR